MFKVSSQSESVLSLERKKVLKGRIVNGILLGSVVILAILSLMLGPGGLMFVKIKPWLADADLARTILFEIRMPRVVLAILAGSSLALAGSSLQGLLRNPLIEPGVFGIGGGAVFGAVLVIYFGLAAQSPLMIPMGGLIGALIAVFFLLGFSRLFRGSLSLILSGALLNTLFFSLTYLFLNFAKNPYSALEILFWQMGSISDRSWFHVTLVLPFFILGVALIFSARRDLDLLTLGEETAISMGLSMRKTYWKHLGGASCLVGAVVSVCGNIGFVGLMIPHLVRPFTGHIPSKSLWPSMLAGAGLILAADFMVRILPTGTELKLGVITSLLGAPFLFGLLWSLRKKLV